MSSLDCRSYLLAIWLAGVTVAVSGSFERTAQLEQAVVETEDRRHKAAIEHLRAKGDLQRKLQDLELEVAALKKSRQN